MSSARIAVVMLAHEKAAYVERAVRSVTDEAGAALDLVLVDNGSGPEVGEAFSRFVEQEKERPAGAGHRVKCLRFETNVGAVRGRNEAMRAALEGGRSEFVAWVDNDVLARSRNWAVKLVAYLEGRADAGIVAPKLVYPWAPHNIQCAGCDVTRSGRVVFRGRDEPRDDPRFNRERDCPALISACWVMRTALFRELGPLDDIFSPVQFEDIDYCYRAREAGYACVYLSSVEMYHFEGMTTARTGALNYDRLTATNAVRFKRKWRAVIEREGGIDDAGARGRDAGQHLEVPTLRGKSVAGKQITWKRDVGWRPIEEIGRLDLID